MPFHCYADAGFSGQTEGQRLSGSPLEIRSGTAADSANVSGTSITAAIKDTVTAAPSKVQTRCSWNRGSRLRRGLGFRAGAGRVPACWLHGANRWDMDGAKNRAAAEWLQGWALGLPCAYDDRDDDIGHPRR
jgi:hypothetical protein